MLSISNDRPAMVSMKWLSDPPNPNNNRLPPSDIMRRIARIALRIMNMEQALDVNQCLDILSDLDDSDSRSEIYLQRRDKCLNLQQHFQHLTIRFHLSFVASMICRPVLAGSAQIRGEQNFATLRDRAKHSLMSTCRIFLEFQALSLIPMRTWSITHCVLCCTILLCVWEETRDNLESRTLQQRVVEAFSRVVKLDEEAGDVVQGQSPCKSSWLSTGHVLALVALQKSLRSSTLVPPKQSNARDSPPGQDSAASVVAHPDVDFNFTTMLGDG